MKTKVLIYPSNTEIALEVNRALRNSKFFELWSEYDENSQSSFVYEHFTEKLPFITDNSTEEDIISFNAAIEKYHFDYIYPCMDGVITKFSQCSKLLDSTIIAPSSETVLITRSKEQTYRILEKTVRVPKLYEKDILFPCFIKPDVGQGAVGAKKIDTKEQLEIELSKTTSKILICEYIDGPEYTVDCFSNKAGKLVFCQPRQRNRMKNGISMDCIAFFDPEIKKIAEEINRRIKNIGGWFFQIKRNSNDEYVLMEVASRIAGTSSFTRGLGVNLPLLTMFEFMGNTIEFVNTNKDDSVHMDRALYNCFKVSDDYDSVYIDYDDTLVLDGKVNIQLLAFLYQCLNENKKIILLSKHDGSLEDELKRYRLNELFDKIIHLDRGEDKSKYIESENSIFIDDSFGERENIRKKKGINVYDPSMVESLIKGGQL